MNKLKKLFLLIPLIVLAVCFISYYIIHNKQNYLIISVIPSHFYNSNKETINPVITFIQKKCITKKPTELTLKFDYMNQDRILLNSHAAGFSSFFKEYSLIEINIYKYAYYSEQEQENLLLHEIGHTIGLQHDENPNSIMNKETIGQDRKNDFISTIITHCLNIGDVPRQ